jgi:hypothetical protein
MDKHDTKTIMEKTQKLIQSKCANPVWIQCFTNSCMTPLDYILDSSIKHVYVDPVTFRFRKYDDWSFVNENQNQNQKQIFIWRTMLFKPFFTRLYFYADHTLLEQTYNNNNNNNNNDDNKDLMNDKLVEWTKYLHPKQGVTILDMTEGIYRVKGLKYNHCREFFSNVMLSLDEHDSTILRIYCEFGINDE